MMRSIPPVVTQTLASDADGIASAVALLEQGQCVAMPTETVYGLAADASSANAVAALYAAKGRPSHNPLIVHVADAAMADALAHMDAPARLLMEKFWPGPLTLVLPRRLDARLAPAVTANLPTVALRCPAHPVMQAVIAGLGRPLAAPSANASGTVSPTNAAHVARTLNGRIAAIIDDGTSACGLESTIVGVEHDRLILLRPGPIDGAALAAAAGLPIAGPQDDRIVAPGQLASHYAPGKPVLLNCTAPPPDCFCIGFGTQDGDVQLSARADLSEAARNLYAALHLGAQSACPRIAVAPIPIGGIGDAINDRLKRAAA